MISSEFYKQYDILMKLFKFSGQNIFDAQNNYACSSVFNKFALVLILIVVMIFTVCHTAYLFISLQNNGNLIDLCVDVSFFVLNIEGIILHSIFYIKKLPIRNCLIKIGEQWRDDIDLKPHLVVIKKECLKPAYSLSYKYSVIETIFAFIYLLGPLAHAIFIKFIILDENPKYVVRFHFSVPYGLQDHFLVYVLFNLYDFLLAINLNFLIHTGLIILAITMNNLRTLFVLLQNDFKTLFDSGDEFDEEEMKRLVRRHICLLDLMQEISNSFGGISAVHLLFISSTIAFFGLSIHAIGAVQQMQNLGASFVYAFSFFSCCFYGQLLSESCVDIGNKIYESDWYNLEPRHRKKILIILNRTQQVTYIKSISLMEISLEIFKKVMKMSWSLLSVTATVYQEE